MSPRAPQRRRAEQQLHHLRRGGPPLIARARYTAPKPPLPERLSSISIRPHAGKYGIETGSQSALETTMVFIRRLASTARGRFVALHRGGVTMRRWCSRLRSVAGVEIVKVPLEAGCQRVARQRLGAR